MNDRINQGQQARLAAVFPILVEQILNALSRSPDRDFHILRRRYGLDGAPPSTLEELGACYGICRERIRQIQAQAVQRVRKVLAKPQETRKFKPAASLRRDFASLSKNLQRAPGVFTRRQFEEMIEANCGGRLEDDWFELLATLLEMKRLAPSSKVNCSGFGELWCSTDLISGRDADAIFKYLDELRSRVDAKTLPHIMSRLKVLVRGEIDLNLVRTILENFEPVELKGDVIRVRTKWLKYPVDQLFRVLEKADDPLSRDEITRRFNVIRVARCNGKALSVEDVGNRLSTDERFVNAGKSGFWALRCWNRLPQMTIVEAMEHALHGAGKPLRLPELLEATRRLRPGVARRSVVTYSSQNERFVRISDGRIALASWKLPDHKTGRRRTRLSRSDLVTGVEIVRGGRESMPLVELVAQLVDLLDKSEPTIRQRLARLDGLEFHSAPGARGKVVRFASKGNGSSVGPTDASPLKRDRIQSEIRRCLKGNPRPFSRKVDLWKKVNERVPCERSTFYRYLSEMQQVRSEHAL